MTAAALFDFDLTLADSTPGAVACIEFALERMGIARPDAAALAETVGLSLPRTFEQLTGRTDTREAALFTRLFVQHADQVMAPLTTVYAAVPGVIGRLRDTGIKTAIVSTKYRYRIEGILAREGLAHLFDSIVGGEDVARHKPHPDGLLRALEILGVTSEQAVYVGDHPVDAEAAQKAGVRFVGVLTGHSPADQFDGYPKLGLVGSLEHMLGAVGQ